MIINSKKFEDKLSILINKELDEVHPHLFKDGKEALASKIIDLQSQILKSIHSVTEEFIVQMSNGLLINLRSKKIPFYNLKKEE